MDLEVIKTVLMVARLKSFSAAAFAIPCAQSSVSRRVESAEDELGVMIFSRPSPGGSRSVELTAAGEEVVRAMIKVLDAYAEMLSVADWKDDARITINIGMRINIMAPMGLSLMKADFFEDNQDLGVSIHTDGFDVLMSELRMRRLDAVLFNCATLDPSSLRLSDNMKLLPLGKMGFSVGISSKNPLSRRSKLRLEDLRDEEFLLGDETGDTIPGIVFSNPGRFVGAVKNAVKGAYTPTVKLIPSNMLEVRYKLTVDNKGVFPSHTPVPWRRVDGVVYIPLEDVDLNAYYFMLYISGRRERQVKAFARFFSKRLEQDEVRALCRP